MIVWSSRVAVPVPSTTRTCVSAMTGAFTLTYASACGRRVGRSCAIAGAVVIASAIERTTRVMVGSLFHTESRSHRGTENILALEDQLIKEASANCGV